MKPRVIIAGIPDSDLNDYLFPEFIVRVRELSKTSCAIVMVDGSRYTFSKPGRDILQTILDCKVEEDDGFADLLPGTDIVQ